MATSLSWLAGSTSTSQIFPVCTDQPVSELLAKMLFLTPTRSLTRCFTRDFADRRFSLTATFLGRSAAHREASRLRVQPWSVMASSAASTVAEPAQGGPSQADQPDKEALLERFLTEQQRAARLEPADEARTLVALGGIGTISTLGASGDAAGYPTGSVVQFAADESGRPIFAFSSLSGHTRDLRADPRCSLTVASPTFRDMADARFTLLGSAKPIAEGEVAAARALFLARHAGSFWVDFGDFTWFRLEDVVQGRLVGGFARARTVSAMEYSAALPDPVAQYSRPIAGHMNADHADSTAAMVRHYLGLPVDAARIIDLDRLGLNLEVEFKGESMRARLPFPRPAESRADIKTIIVECTRAAAAAAV